MASCPGPGLNNRRIREDPVGLRKTADSAERRDHIDLIDAASREARWAPPPGGVVRSFLYKVRDSAEAPRALCGNRKGVMDRNSRSRFRAAVNA